MSDRVIIIRISRVLHNACIKDIKQHLPPNKPLMMKGEVSTIALFSIYGKRFVSVLVEPAFDYSMQTSRF